MAGELSWSLGGRGEMTAEAYLSGHRRWSFGGIRLSTLSGAPITSGIAPSLLGSAAEEKLVRQARRWIRLPDCQLM